MVVSYKHLCNANKALACTTGFILSLAAIAITASAFQEIALSDRIKVNKSLTSPQIPRKILSEEQIISWDLFGAYAKPTHTKERTIKRTNLNLKLLGVFSEVKTNIGWAIVSSNDNPPLLYFTGDTIIDNTKLIKTEQNRILIERNGTTEFLSLVQKEKEDHVKVKEKNISIQEKKKHNEQEVGNLRSNLLKRFKLTPVAKGTPSGYRVGEESRELEDRYGLKPGDIIISANGYPLGTESDDMLAASSLERSGKAEVVISRGNREFTILYP